MEAMKQTILDKLSVEQIKIELMRTAFGRQSTLLSKFDPRILLIWYSFFAVAPWFIHNKAVLLGLLVPMIVLTLSSKVSPLVLIILGVGLVSEIGYILAGSLLFGGSLDAVWPMMTLTLKLLIISLSSIAVFNSMDPEKLSDALLSLGMPGQFSFGVSYGYRMLPILIEEYHNIIHSYRLRGRSPANKGVLRWRSLVYMARISVYAFYPLILNTAKRTRTTVEALEVKGFTYALVSPEAKKLKLAYLRVRPADFLFLAVSLLYVAALFTAASYIAL
ncbi:energy-coupling factor transporter transmembrane protein EcfT [Paenibacillus sp. NEAU-GSW1]|uniref:energy-coupling factor transporter transmembrane component T family protein n=1 Tax=Paenibacillus sp. NEAU-GSW1 TaxID=2682486 RepID=UPI0012E20594|nr:energy-coupling factor transporter transmembrane component T [Paenibacillus sp. NEAU-GSW1]MUT67936.1 energy-coupling factor transporter transmembrane protein EcfT [Paenibacillus sp. NEAU-GSW1]